MSIPLYRLSLATLIVLGATLVGYAQDEQQIEAVQDERESLRWAPERDIRTMQKRHQENQLELNRQANSVAEALRGGRDAASKAIDGQKAQVRDEEIQTRDEQVNASEKRQLNQARTEQARQVQDAVGFSGTQLIDLGIEQSQRKAVQSGAVSETQAKRREAGFLKEQEGFLMNEQRRLEVLGEPEGAKSLEGEVGAVQNRLENLEKPPSTFFPGMPLGNPSPDREWDR